MSKKYNKNKNINSELKEQKSDIEKVFDQLLKAIKNLDENLYREIEDDLKYGQGYKRDNMKSNSNVSDNSKKYLKTMKIKKARSSNCYNIRRKC